MIVERFEGLRHDRKFLIWISPHYVDCMPCLSAAPFVHELRIWKYITVKMRLIVNQSPTDTYFEYSMYWKLRLSCSDEKIDRLCIIISWCVRHSYLSWQRLITQGRQKLDGGWSSRSGGDSCLKEDTEVAPKSQLTGPRANSESTMTLQVPKGTRYTKALSYSTFCLLLRTQERFY